jgi:AcrR family transcriptional regulator
MSAARRARNPRGEGGRLREEIVAAAIALIDGTDDPATLTLRGIARQAGISAPSIYGRFPDLPAVIEAVLERSFDELREQVAAAVAAGPDPAGGLIGAGRAYVDFGWRHRARYRLMFDATGYAPNSVETFAVVEDAIRACAGLGLSASTSPHLDAWMLWAGLHGVATLDRPGRDDLLRLGPLNRPAMLEAIIRRLARLPEAPAAPDQGAPDRRHE